MLAHHGGMGHDVRTLFISDAHLGNKHAQPRPLLEFLERYTPESLYIVGDFIDGWQLKRSFHWLPEYNGLLTRLAELSESGTDIIYLPGNHDEFLRCESLRKLIAAAMPFARFVDEDVFETADQRRFLVTHGDRFDVVERSAQWLSKSVAGIYNALLSCNWYWSRARRRTTMSPYQACAFIKDQVKGVVRFLSSFENALLQHARHHNCEGVICGHIHSPAILTRNGMTYCNTGDWVENCTALIEWPDGTLQLKYFYPDDRRQFEQIVISPPRRPVIDCDESSVGLLDHNMGVTTDVPELAIAGRI
ncbi:MAG: UDP-2,3-diacylglucosamine diphosphatase [Planctomycetaceae bacterium]|nr:UDP-2,3-diacylglucosamine diphosphatase [Planctomycetaceae bacterium]